MVIKCTAIASISVTEVGVGGGPVRVRVSLPLAHLGISFARVRTDIVCGI